MFDIWLTESTKIVQEIIEKSNLKKITEAVIKDFMTTETFANFIESKVENQVEQTIERYIRDTIEDYGDIFHPSVNEDVVKRAVVKVIKEKFEKEE